MCDSSDEELCCDRPDCPRKRKCPDPNCPGLKFLEKYKVFQNLPEKRPHISRCPCDRQRYEFDCPYCIKVLTTKGNRLRHILHEHKDLYDYETIFLSKQKPVDDNDNKGDDNDNKSDEDDGNDDAKSQTDANSQTDDNSQTNDNSQTDDESPTEYEPPSSSEDDDPDYVPRKTTRAQKNQVSTKGKMSAAGNVSKAEKRQSARTPRDKNKRARLS